MLFYETREAVNVDPTLIFSTNLSIIAGHIDSYWKDIPVVAPFSSHETRNILEPIVPYIQEMGDVLDKQFWSTSRNLWICC